MDVRNPDARFGRAAPKRASRRGPMPVLLGASVALVALIVLGGAAFFTGILPHSLPLPVTALAVADNQTTAKPGADAASAQQAEPVVTTAQTPAPAPTLAKQQNYGDWLYSCAQAANGTIGSCSIVQRLVETNSKAAIFLWRIVQDGKGGLVALWQTPEAVLLSNGLVLDAGTPKPIAVPYAGCGSGRCQAVANLDPDFVATLQKSRKIGVGFVLANGQAVRLNISTSGLADGLAALQSKPAPAKSN